MEIGETTSEAHRRLRYWIRFHMERQGWGLDRTALAARISKAGLRNMLSQKHSPMLSSIDRVAWGLGVEVSDLFAIIPE